MLAAMKSRLIIVLLVGTAWLGSYTSCDTGGLTGTLGGYYDTIGGYFVDSGGYYVDPYWTDYSGGYSYEPYMGDYYEATMCCDSVVY